jgi:hypothetical protein
VTTPCPKRAPFMDSGARSCLLWRSHCFWDPLPLHCQWGNPNRPAVRLANWHYSLSSESKMSFMQSGFYPSMKIYLLVWMMPCGCNWTGYGVLAHPFKSPPPHLKRKNNQIKLTWHPKLSYNCPAQWNLSRPPGRFIGLKMRRKHFKTEISWWVLFFLYRSRWSGLVPYQGFTVSPHIPCIDTRGL